MPDFIADNLQIIIGLAAAIAYWLNHQREKKAQEEEARRNIPEEEDFFGPDFDFGEPEGTREAPPWMPPPIPSSPPPLPKVAVPPQASVDRELARQQELQDRLKELRSAKKSASPRGRPAQAGRGAVATPLSPITDTSLRQRLRNKSEVRRAIVMKEILGPPVGLR